MNRGNAGKGGRRGVQNRITCELREIVLAALKKAGGIDYLATQAEAGPTAFLILLGKLLPLETRLSPPDEPRNVVIEIIDPEVKGASFPAEKVRTISKLTWNDGAQRHTLEVLLLILFRQRRFGGVW